MDPAERRRVQDNQRKKYKRIGERRAEHEAAESLRAKLSLMAAYNAWALNAAQTEPVGLADSAASATSPPAASASVGGGCQKQVIQ